jgi:hypothetical protein
VRPPEASGIKGKRVKYRKNPEQVSSPAPALFFVGSALAHQGVACEVTPLLCGYPNQAGNPASRFYRKGKMKKYHKIQSLFERDRQTNKLIEGKWTLPEFEYLQSNEWIFTEKVDGTNVRIMFDGEKIRFGGREDDAQLSVHLFSELTDLFFPQIDTFKKKFPDGVCLYGEGYGPKIQDVGHLYSDKYSFVLFDVRIGEWWLQQENVQDVAINLGLDVVPIIGIGSLHEAIDRCRDGFNSQWGDFRAEGIVARPRVDLQTRGGDRIITKVKCVDFD